MNNDVCPFCKEEQDRKANLIKKSRVIAETNDFIIFPTVGGFVENYQLIVPRKHINCFGQLKVNEWDELKEIIMWQKKINEQYFNSGTLMFEHGALFSNNESGKSIVHANLHIFPSNTSLMECMVEYNLFIQRIMDISQLSEFCHKYESYLYYGDFDNKDYVITHQGLPSQFLRKVLADSLGISTWNWREFPYIENIENCIKFYRTSPHIYDYLNSEEKI